MPELLGSALTLADDLLKQAKLPAAAALGRKGGSAIAKCGSDYVRYLAAGRKTHGGGEAAQRIRITQLDKQNGCPVFFNLLPRVIESVFGCTHS
jgi:hypothetical protein